MTSAHTGEPPAPHDLWSAWNLDPLVLAMLLVAAWVYRCGRMRDRRHRAGGWRTRAFGCGLTVLGVALLSPLESVSAALASAHMVQHLLIVLVAAPLLAFSHPWPTLLLGMPARLRRTIGRWRGRLMLNRRTTRALRHPGAVWLTFVGTLWFWHAALPYGLALEYRSVHIVQHGTFLLTGMLCWWIVVHAVRTGRPSPGFAVVYVFTIGMQGVFLSALLTFANAPWYARYTLTTKAWNLEPLADQQLAGVIMWITGNLIYLATALTLLVVWIRRSEPVEPAVRLRAEGAETGQRPWSRSSTSERAEPR